MYSLIFLKSLIPVVLSKPIVQGLSLICCLKCHYQFPCELLWRGMWLSVTLPSLLIDIDLIGRGCEYIDILLSHLLLLLLLLLFAFFFDAVELLTVPAGDLREQPPTCQLLIVHDHCELYVLVHVHPHRLPFHTRGVHSELISVERVMVVLRC